MHSPQIFFGLRRPHSDTSRTGKVREEGKKPPASGHTNEGAEAEDKEAGELDKPFTETQTEDDEEWMGWVDWGALGGGSGSA